MQLSWFISPEIDKLVSLYNGSFLYNVDWLYRDLLSFTLLESDKNCKHFEIAEKVLQSNKKNVIFGLIVFSVEYRRVDLNRAQTISNFKEGVFHYIAY
jgi:hypothetical protein